MLEWDRKREGCRGRKQRKIEKEGKEGEGMNEPCLLGKWSFVRIDTLKERGNVPWFFWGVGDNAVAVGYRRPCV